MDVTVFNKYYDSAAHEEKYKCTVIDALAWQETKAANIVKSGMQDADSTMIFIPMGQEGYIKPLQWDHVNGWTLQSGDVIVKGAIDHTGTIEDIFTTYDDAITITSVDTYDYGSPDMQHWEVSGK